MIGRKCCVRRCESNSNGLQTSFFQFPTDEERKKIWMSNIPRADKFNTQNLGVCILHFDLKYIKAVSETGKPLTRPRLTNDVIPTIFSFNDGVPEIFHFEPEIIYRKQHNVDLICDFNNFKNEFSKHIDILSWLTTSDDYCVTFFKLQRETNGNLIVQFNINIDKNLNIQIFNEHKKLDYTFYKEMIPRHQRLNLFSELDKILKKCEKEGDIHTNDEAGNVKKYLKNALHNITEAKRLIENISDFENANCVKILHDQLIQLTENRRRYSINTILCAYTLYIQSPETYELIRDWSILILPNKSTLQKLTRFQDVDPSSNSSNMSYLKKIVSNLTYEEKYVIVQLNEIYSNPQVIYWKQLTGFAENTDEVATTVLGVLVSSCFGNMKEIVNLIPMKDGTGNDLHRYAMDIVDSLQAIGLIILAFVTDNNCINQKLFSLFAPDGSYCFQNPKFLERKIRLIFDSLHVFKNVRNNWVNKKDSDKSFFYPKFDNFSIIQQATFQDMRDLYHSKKLKIIKSAPKLNTRTLYPSNFDRQRVPLVLNIVHPTTIAAYCGYTETAEFLGLIKVWFTIINNTTKKMGIGNGVDKWLEPITSANGFQVAFLRKFVDWLKHWKDLGSYLHVGGLTKDTFEAAISCTEGMIQLIDDAFATCNIQTFLPGKIQTNELEKRFGRYRELSGSNYNVSVKQILESEKKLRIRTLISALPDELYSSNYAVKKTRTVDLTIYLDLLDSNYINNFKDYEHSAFMYVSGYAGYTIVRQLKCAICRDLIIKTKGGITSTDYFDHLQRGGLIVPTENCIFLLLHMNALFDELRKDVDDSCLCGQSYENLFMLVLTVFANILLNNYRKKINDLNQLRKINNSANKKRKAQQNKEDSECSIY